MKINFFETSDGMNPRAIGPGVYMIELENKRIGKKICLYVGESVWIVARCGVHLCSLYDDPNYLGLNSDDLENDDFILRFSVVETIAGKKVFSDVGNINSEKWMQ